VLIKCHVITLSIDTDELPPTAAEQAAERDDATVFKAYSERGMWSALGSLASFVGDLATRHAEEPTANPERDETPADTVGVVEPATP
jgi:hypothetical protein